MSDKHLAEAVLVILGKLDPENASGVALTQASQFSDNERLVRGVQFERERRLLEAGVDIRQLFLLLNGRGIHHHKGRALEILASCCLDQGIDTLQGFLKDVTDGETGGVIARSIAAHRDCTKAILWDSFRLAKRTKQDNATNLLADGLIKRDDCSDDELITELRAMEHRDDIGYLALANGLEFRLNRHQPPLSFLLDLLRNMRPGYFRDGCLMRVLEFRGDELVKLAGLDTDKSDKKKKVPKKKQKAK